MTTFPPTPTTIPTGGPGVPLRQGHLQAHELLAKGLAGTDAAFAEVNPFWPGLSAGTDGRFIYVSPNGNDNLSGLTPGNARQTLAGALALLGGSAAWGTRILVSGQIGPGSSSTLTIPSGAILQGVGPTSRVHWATDLGAGVPALTTGLGNPFSPQIESLTLVGPAGFAIPSPGVAPAASMWGLFTSSHSTYRNLYLSGFYANVVIGADHEAFYNIIAQGGFYNLYFRPDAPSGGGQKFYNVVLYTAARASIGVGPGNVYTSGLSVGLETGNCPFGLYKEARTTGTNTNGLLSNCNLYGLSFESIGNACIYDARLAGTGAGNGIIRTFTDFGNSTNSWSSAWADPAIPSAFTFYIPTNYWTIGVTSGGAYTATPPGGTGVFGSPFGTNVPRYL